MEPYLYHGIKFKNLDVLIEILSTGFILPKSMQKNAIDDGHNIFNGDKYISLSQKTLIEDDMRYRARCSFDSCIHNNINIVISNFWDIIYPDYVNWDYLSPERARAIKLSEDRHRYSDCMDEVQTDKPVPKSNFIAIGYPTNLRSDPKEAEADVKRIYEALERAQLRIPVIDSSHYDFADTEEHIKKYTL
jgi:hypothetical protein